MNMSDDSTMSPVQALKALWQKHAGVPEEGTEDAGRWEVLRRAAAAQGEGVAFDEWVLEQEARLDERGMLIDIRNAERRQAAALEQLAEAVEAQRLNHVASLTVGELMDGVNFDSEPKPEELNAEGAKCTSYVRLAIEDFGFGLEVRAYDDGPVEAYGDATAEWSFRSPEDVRALASAFRTKYATLLDMAAERWERGLRNGSIQTGEAAA